MARDWDSDEKAHEKKKGERKSWSIESAGGCGFGSTGFKVMHLFYSIVSSRFLLFAMYTQNYWVTFPYFHMYNKTKTTR